MKNTCVFVVSLGLLVMSESAAAQNNNKVVVIPLSSTEMPKATPETIMSASGTWSNAGLSGIPSMIIKDLIVYADSVPSPPCRFSMSYVINNISSRTLRRFSLFEDQSVQVSFGAGVNSRDLRFGTISSGGGACVRNWAVFGVALPE